MNDLLESLAGTTVLIIVGVIIGGISWYITDKRDTKNQPDEDMRNVYLKEVSMMRESGRTYKDRFLYLKEKGLRKTVAEQILAEDIQKSR